MPNIRPVLFLLTEPKMMASIEHMYNGFKKKAIIPKTKLAVLRPEFELLFDISILFSYNYLNIV